MNQAELKEFETRIRARLAELEQNSEAGKQAQSVVELDQQTVGRLSRMDALQNQAMAKAQQTRRDLEARRLNAALARISEGEFGYCEDCGEAIARGRMELDPAAGKCVSCASG
ncbi:transcriptional regulator, TraR/DksA family [Ruegeria intermedia]|uniref:Transcriptional regulator, TraR/DksA family n=1 Tax=Ruegeria intermedia TaxID=996115 RepID=A0A1M4UJC5_9RHOB|nr:TraR/DksA C4-type zinc finger protein [Ruegeria intermedia]SHE56653.1 transcriptional regulator, TraR/DksA family [Ruegeria intermedia]